MLTDKVKRHALGYREPSSNLRAIASTTAWEWGGHRVRAGSRDVLIDGADGESEDNTNVGGTFAVALPG